MMWLLAIALSVLLATLGSRLNAADEVLAIASYITSMGTGLLGFAIAPELVQLSLALLILGRVQASSLRS